VSGAVRGHTEQLEDGNLKKPNQLAVLIILLKEQTKRKFEEFKQHLLESRKEELQNFRQMLMLATPQDRKALNQQIEEKKAALNEQTKRELAEKKEQLKSELKGLLEQKKKEFHYRGGTEGERSAAVRGNRKAR